MSSESNPGDLVWTTPQKLRSAEHYVELTKWFISHMQIVGGWVHFRFFSKSDAEIQALKELCTDLPALPRNLLSMKTLFYHLSNGPRLSQEQTTDLETSVASLGDTPELLLPPTMNLGTLLLSTLLSLTC